MMKKTLALLSLIGPWTLAGCESDSAEKIARLQEQVAKVTQQQNETKKQIDGLQEANQRSVQAIENLQATIGRLSAASSPTSPSGKSTAKTFAEQDIPPSAKQGENPTALFSATTSPAKSSAPSQTKQTTLSADESQAAPHPPGTAADAAVSCGLVWKQLGQGKSAEAIARALGASVDAIQACEQKVGQHGVRR